MAICLVLQLSGGKKKFAFSLLCCESKNPVDAQSQWGMNNTGSPILTTGSWLWVWVSVPWHLSCKFRGSPTFQQMPKFLIFLNQQQYIKTIELSQPKTNRLSLVRHHQMSRQDSSSESWFWLFFCWWSFLPHQQNRVTKVTSWSQSRGYHCMSSWIQPPVVFFQSQSIPFPSPNTLPFLKLGESQTTPRENKGE